MLEFVARENIKRFRAQLRSAVDEHQKAILRNLLIAEQQHLKSLLNGKNIGASDFPISKGAGAKDDI